MNDIIPVVPMRLVEPLRLRNCSQSRRHRPSLRTRGRGVPTCEGFAVAEARVESGAAEQQRRDSALSYLHSPSVSSSDCAAEVYSREGSRCSLSCSVTTEACDCREDKMNEIEVRGPSSIGVARPASTRASTPGSKTALSPPVVCPGRSLELTTRLGMAKLRAELEVAAAANVSDAEKEDGRGRLRSAKLRPLGYIPIEMQPRAACIGITPVSDLPHCPSPRPRSSTEVARNQSSVGAVEEQMHTRSQSAHVMRQRHSFLSISRDSGAVASSKAVHQEEAVSSSESPPLEEDEQPSTRHIQLQPRATPHKISSPIPYNRHEEVDAGSSFSVRGYSSPASDAPPTALLPPIVPTPTCNPQLLSESDHKPAGRVAMVVSAHPPRPFTTLRANISFRYRSTVDPNTSPSRKLHPLRGSVSPQPLAAVKGCHLHAIPPSQPGESKGSTPHPSEWQKTATGVQSTSLPLET